MYLIFFHYLYLFYYQLNQSDWFFLQEKTLSLSSAIDSVNVDERSSEDMEIVNNIVASPKTSKSVKIGEKAPPEVIKIWKENGFSR